MTCREEKVQICIPVVSSWLADHMENVNIHITINKSVSRLHCNPDRTRHVAENTICGPQV